MWPNENKPYAAWNELVQRSAHSSYFNTMQAIPGARLQSNYLGARVATQPLYVARGKPCLTPGSRAGVPELSRISRPASTGPGLVLDDPTRHRVKASASKCRVRADAADRAKRCWSTASRRRICEQDTEVSAVLWCHELCVEQPQRQTHRKRKSEPRLNPPPCHAVDSAGRRPRSKRASRARSR